MKILKEAGTFEILTPHEVLRASLLLIETAGRTCYQSSSPITQETAKEFVRMILLRGHESVIEHSHMAVRFSNLSRGYTHEMVRHRLCAFSQESTRYVDYAKEAVDLEEFQLHCVVPPHRDENEEVEVEVPSNIPNPEAVQLKLNIKDMFAMEEAFYRALRKAGWVPQDARQVLPIGIRSQIVVSCNLREWRHIFKMRTNKAAHWEIRGVMCALLRQVKLEIPVIFDDFVLAGETKGVPHYKQLCPADVWKKEAA